MYIVVFVPGDGTWRVDACRPDGGYTTMSTFEDNEHALHFIHLLNGGILSLEQFFNLTVVRF